VTAPLQQLIEATVEARVAPGARVIEIRSHVLTTRPSPAGDVFVHDVAYQIADGRVVQVKLVTKNAPLTERRLQVWLNDRGLPVPFGHSLDLTSEHSLVCLQYVPHMPEPGSAMQVARGLAAIHAAALDRAADFAWLPRADSNYAADFIVDRCWRRPWQSTRENADFVDAFGRRTPPGPPGDFGAAFDRYRQPLEEAAAHFVRAMEDLWAEGNSLTLIHADFHDDHVRPDGGQVYMIDWGQARYGPLYLDLPNYFTRDEALLYRDALADLGQDIPREEFLARFDATHPYPGFKYFGVGLWNWRYANPPHENSKVQHFVDMVLGS
jgi:hypothetical protein